jgi:hypothetical protein
MAGYETLGGWIVLAAAAAALGMAVIPPRRAVDTAPVVALGAALVPAWLALRFVPLHTWVNWIPPEVQQDYGTEYASVVFSGVPVVWQIVSLGLTVLACVLLVVIGVRGRMRTAEPASEEVTS